MKTLLYSLFVGIVSAGSFGDRTLDKTELNALLSELTAAPRITWLEAGTIRANYLEYRIGENIAYESQELFRFDGHRFYWEIELIDPPAEAGPSEVSRPDYQSNRHRIFAFDGSTYTRYHKSADYAVVVMDQQQIPLNQFGPFSAGVIPWGLGLYAPKNLAVRNPAAVEFFDNGQRRIRLTLTDTTGDVPAELTIVLDPDKDYLPYSYVLKTPVSSIRQSYRDPRQIGQQWVPFIITTERFDLQSENPTLVSYEDWRFTSVDADVPTESFETSFADGTVVELQPYGQMQSILYHAAEGADIACILEEKVLTLAASRTAEQANCATLATHHIARRFSRQMGQAALQTNDQSVPVAASDEPETLTSLHAMGQSLEAVGLHCTAVKTDVKSLAKLQDYGVILHYPAIQHYVVLDRVKDDAVWTVDLTSRKFYWKRSIRELLADWKDGVALLVSDSPIVLNGQIQLLDVQEQMEIRGGSTAVGYSCTELIQQYDEWTCSDPIGGLCGGAYYKFPTRYGCEESTPGQTCTGQKLPGYDYSHCLNDAVNWNQCIITGRFYTRSIRACM